MGVLEKFGVEMIGAKADVIDKAEDRELFREAMKKIGLASAEIDARQRIRRQGSRPRSSMPRNWRASRHEGGDIDGFEREWAASEPERLKKYRNRALVEAFEAMLEIGLPCIIRPSFTLGGTGGGIAYNREEFFDIVETRARRLADRRGADRGIGARLEGI